MKAIFKRIRKSVVLTIATIVLLVAVVGGSLAWLDAETGIIKNLFSVPSMGTTITEEIEDDVKKTVAVTNESDISVYVRVAAVVTWKDSEGNVYSQAPVLGTDYTWTVHTGSSDKWFEYEGFYYYKESVVANGTTSPLFENVKQEDDAIVPEGYSLSVEFIAQGIQAAPENAVEDAWKVEVVAGKLQAPTSDAGGITD